MFEHDTKADKTITGAQFELTSGVVSVPLSWSRQSKVYSSPAEISNAELLGGVRGTKDGYRIKSVQITSDSGGSGARVSGSGTAAKIVGYSKATILTLTLVLQHATKAEKTLSNAAFEIRKMPVPADLTWRKQSKVYSLGGEISNAELLRGLSGTKTGYRIKTVTISNKAGTGARVSGNGTSAKIVSYTKVGILTLSIVFEHDTKEDKNITGGAFEITKGSASSLSWTKQTKPFSSGGEITNADLLAGVTGSGKNGYTIKTVTISNDGGTSAVVSGSGRAAKITSYTKAGTLTLTLVLAHDTKKDATIRNAEFEITKDAVPSLSWTKQTKPFSSGGEITNIDLLAGVMGSDKNGYTIKTVTITSTNGTGARVSGSGTTAKITSYTKVGTLTLTLVLQHTSKPDVTLRNAQFEITKGSAESLSWTKQTKPFSSGGEITNANLLAGVTGSGKTGYTIKTVTISNDGGITSARVSGSGRAAKITSYTKAGTLTLTIVLEHHTKEDVTLRNAQFEIMPLSWTKQTKPFSSSGEISNAELLAGVTGSGKTGYTIKTVTITSTNGTSARVSGSGTSAKITSYTKVGTLTLTIVLEQDTKDDVTLRNAEFHIYRDIFTISSSGEVTLKTSVDKNSLTTVTIPYMINGTTVTSIGVQAFSYCGALTSITIPNSVTSIGNKAFFNCTSLHSITLLNSLTSIGDDTFRGCNSFTSITIPNSVISIGSGAFSYCSQLTSITISNSVISIGIGAFYECKVLTNITMGNSVTSIGKWIFAYCKSLTTIKLPNSITTIGDEPFRNCSQLTTIHVPNAKVSGWEANLKKGNGASVVGY